MKKKQRHISMLRAAKMCHYPISYSNRFWKNTAHIWAINNRFFVNAHKKIY